MSNLKGIIIVNGYAFDNNAKYQCARLIDEAIKLDVALTVKLSTEMLFCVENGSVRDIASGMDFVIFLDKDKALSSMLEKSKMRLFNTARAIEVCDDKMTTYIELSNFGIDMPLTIPSPLCYRYENKSEEFKRILLSKLTFPIIVKECYGSLGAGVYMVTKELELDNIMEKLRYKPHLFQQMIRSSYGRDIRAIVIGGKFVTAMLRTSKGDFRSNIELGGVGEKITLTMAQKELCERIAGKLELDYCGIDLLFGEGENLILCEVNSNAYFKGIEAVTGENIAKRYIEYIIDTIGSKDYWYETQIGCGE